jgi:ABC-2 type transport system ATP-binding protein
VREVRQGNGTISLIADNTHVTIPALLAALGGRASALTHLATHQATLEDLFVALTGRHLRDD